MLLSFLSFLSPVFFVVRSKQKHKVPAWFSGGFYFYYSSNWATVWRMSGMSMPSLASMVVRGTSSPLVSWERSITVG